MVDTIEVILIQDNDLEHPFELSVGNSGQRLSPTELYLLSKRIEEVMYEYSALQMSAQKSLQWW